MIEPDKDKQMYPKTCHGRWMSEEYVPGLASVIIPTYNRAEMLVEAIDSVWQQTYRPIELIVVDDGSTDDTSEVIEQWRQKHVHDNDDQFELRYFRQENAGAPVARNRGLIESKGEFIQMLDSDDILLPQKLAESVDKFRACSKVDMVYCPYIIDFGSGQKGLDFFLSKTEESNLSFDLLCIRSTKLWTGSPVHRRRIVVKAGPWNEKLLCCQDVEWHPRLMIHVRKTAKISTPQAIYRRHSEETISEERAFSIKHLHSKYKAILSIANTLETAKVQDENTARYLASSVISCARAAIPSGAPKLSRNILSNTKHLYSASSRYRLEATAWKMISFLPSFISTRVFRVVGTTKHFLTQIYSRSRRISAIKKI